MGGKGDCQVCYDTIEEEVKMCPSCNAIFCQRCIEKFKRPQCPSCRSHQVRASYVRNRIAEEMIKEMLFAKHLRCKLHDLEKCYFCMNEECLKPLCPDCFMENHIGHKRRKITEVYREKKEEVDAVMEPL